MSLRVCSEPGCPNLSSKSTCPDHHRTRQQRGYTAAHDAERRRWLPIVRAGQATCWRCHTPIAADARWDLGHDDTDRSKYRGPEHVACNRATAGRR